MKKSVVIIVLFILLVTQVFARQFTGAQVIDLPAPPAPPGLEQAQSQPTVAPIEIVLPQGTNETAVISDVANLNATALSDRVDVLEQKVHAIDVLPQFEKRLNVVEGQSAAASTVENRVVAVQSQLDALKVDVDNVKSAPQVQQPSFVDLNAIKKSIRITAWVSISLAVVALVIVLFLLFFVFSNRKDEDAEQKTQVKEYLRAYQQKGYSLDELKNHLQSAGWDVAIIAAAAKEL